MSEQTIKIGGLNYSLNYVPAHELDGNFGECNNRACEIRISDDLPPGLSRSVILHEVIEAINFNAELKLEHPAIMAIEQGIFQVLTDNPGLLD